MPKLNFFEKVKLKKPRHSTFDLSYINTLTTQFGTLTPVYCEPVVPGDKLRGSSEFFVRFQPLIAPVMQNIDISVHYFFVPERLVWKNFGDWIKGFNVETSPVPQYLYLKEVNEWHRSEYNHWYNYTHDQVCGPGSLWDYLGYPVLDENTDYGQQRVKANRLLAYTLIWREYYRDQNLTDEIQLFETQNGRLSPAMMLNFIHLRQRAWQKDYFTSALPWPQRGADVHLPMTGDASLNTDAIVEGWKPSPGEPGTPYPLLLEKVGSSTSDSGNVHYNTSGGVTTITGENDLGGMSDGYYRLAGSAVHLSNGTVDMSQVTAATINDLRKANALQKWFELKARTGNRLKEFLLANFGIAPRDLRLDRPEYLGGGKQPVVIMDVLQNSSTNETSPQGNLAGQAASYGKTNHFYKKVDEHGFIIGIMSITPQASYFQGCPRDLQKFDQLDYYFPLFQHLGEQEIRNSEIFFSGDAVANEGTFGYTPRYAEYKFHGNEIHGSMRDTLDFWHLGRKFSNTPTLSEAFVSVRPGSDADNLNRIFAYEGEDFAPLLVQVNNKVRAIRPMDYYTVPSL